jgi:hypothetical protein
MLSKIKVLVIAAGVASAASSAFAQGLVPYYNYSPTAEHYNSDYSSVDARNAGRTVHLREGRNSASQSDYSAGGTSTGRHGARTRKLI